MCLWLCCPPVLPGVGGQEEGAGQEWLGLTVHVSHPPGPEVVIPPHQLAALLNVRVSDQPGPGLQVQLRHVGVQLFLCDGVCPLPDVLLPVLRVDAEVAGAQGGGGAAAVRAPTAVLAIH